MTVSELNPVLITRRFKPSNFKLTSSIPVHAVVFFFVSTLLTFNSTYSQSGWTNQSDYLLGDDAQRVVVDPAGQYIYVAGSLNTGLGGLLTLPSVLSGTSLSTSLFGYGGKDAYVAKYTSTGTMVWTINFGSSGDDEATGICIASDGNIYVTGYYSANMSLPSVDGSPTLSITDNDGSTKRDGFIASYTPSGDSRWAKYNGGDSHDHVHSVCAVTGGIAVIGDYQKSGNTNIQNTTPNEFGGIDMYIAKYGLDGSSAWFISAGTPQNDYLTTPDFKSNRWNICSDGVSIYAISNTAQGSYLNYNTSNSLDATLNFSDGDAGLDYVIHCIANNGSISWAKPLQCGTKSVGGSGIAVNATGLYIVSNLNENITWPDGSTHSLGAGMSDIVISRLRKNNGSRIWYKELGGTEAGTPTNIPLDMKLSNDSLIYFAGRFRKAMTIDTPNLPGTSGSVDAAFAISFTREGAYIKGASYNVANGVNVLGIAWHPVSRDCILCGSTKSDLVTGTNILNTSEDSYIHSINLNDCSDLVFTSAVISNDTICAGDAITLTASAVYGNIQWQSSLDGALWTNTITGNPITLTPTIPLHFRAQLSYSGCSDVYSTPTQVHVDYLQIADAGNDIMTCTDTVIISGNTALSDNLGVWRIVSGTGTFDNDQSAVTRIHTFSDPVTIAWTINSGACGTSSDIIQINADHTRPQFACPPNVFQHVDNSCRSTIPDLISGLIATDNCTPSAMISVAQNPAPGTVIFGEGTWTVAISATDLEGNEQMCTVFINAIDTLNPVLLCPTDISVATDAGSCSAMVTLPVPTFSDNCGVHDVNWWLTGTTSGASSGSGINVLTTYEFQKGTTQVNYIVRDSTGHNNTCSFMVEVYDNEAPLVTCADTVTAITNTASCTATIGSLVPTFSDNCTVVFWNNSYNLLQDAAGEYAVGTHDVIWYVGDGNGNTGTCTTTIIVADSIYPTIVCPPSVDTTLTGISCFVNFALPVATAGDNCPGVIITNDYNGGGSFVSGNFFPGVTTITYKALDAAGNTTTCTTEITVNDTVAPAITCVPDIYTITDVGLCTDSVLVPLPIVATPCGSYTISNDYNSTSDASDVYSSGMTAVTWTVADIYGNTSTCITNIHVDDIQNPDVICPNDTTLYSSTTTCDAFLNTSMTPIATDNCSILSIVSDHPATTYPQGNTTVHWIITDINGRQTGCVQQVFVVDTIKPLITCPIDRNFNTTSTTCSRNVATIGTPVTSDNCSIQSVFNDHPSTTYFLGDTYVTWTAIDIHGNSNSCIQTITIEDDTDPSIICPPTITTTTDANSCTTTIANLGSPTTVWDNCSIASVTHTHPSSIYPKGTTSVIWTITDGSGNDQTCVQSVVVNDVTLPVVDCPNDTVVTANNGCQATIFLPAPAISDNCTMQRLGWQLTGATLANSPNTGFNNLTAWTFNHGVTYVTYFLRDSSGNIGTCTFTVTVTESTSPGIACPATYDFPTLPGECFATITPAMIGSATATDNCGTTTVWSDFSGGNMPPGIHTVNWFATDNDGNQSTCQQTFTVTDVDIPVIDCIANILEYSTTSSCDISISIPVPDVTDNCSTGVLVNSYNFTNDASDVYPVGATTIEWVVYDVSGNPGYCYTIVEVMDTIPPTLICPNDTTFANEPGYCEYNTIHIGDPVVNDNCGVIDTYCDHPNTSYPVGTTSVLWTAVDDAGNTNTCTQLVMVEDVELPIIDCPNDITLHSDTLICGLLLTSVEIGDAVVTDNCNVLGWSNNHPNTFYPVGTTSIEWIASDVHNNMASCIQYVNIVDANIPDITCPVDTVFHADSLNCEIYLTSLPGTPEVYDECGIGLLYNDFNSSLPLQPGDHDFTWIVIDNNDNMNYCHQYLTVVDVTIPEILCPDTIIRYLDETCSYITEDLSGEVLMADNCSAMSEISWTQTPAAGTIEYDPHEYNMNFEVWDLTGNITSCQSLVILLDTIPPQITCPGDQIIPAISNCEGILPNYSLSGLTSEECGLAVLSQSPLAGTVVLSNTTVTLMIVDGSGNSATCQFEVITTDDVAPTINVPALDPIYSDSSCQAIVPDYTALLTVADNCTAQEDLTVIQSPGEGSVVYYPGLQEIIFQVIDAAGNSTNDTAYINVADTLAPYIDCPLTQYLALDYTCYAEIPDFSSWIYTHDGCSWTTFQQIPAPGASVDAGSHTITTIVSDDFGNADTCAFTLEVYDGTYPDIWVQKIVNISTIDLYSYMTADSVLIIDDGQASIIDTTQASPCTYFVELPQPVVQDNCGIQSITNDYTGTDNASGFYPIGYTAIQWAITDIHGNTTYDMVELTISYDESIPVVCPADTTIANEPDSCGAWFTLSPPVSGPHCSMVSFWNDYTSDSGNIAYFPIGMYDVQWEISDGDGNFAYCLQNIVVADVQAPEVICPSSDTIQTTTGFCEVYYELPQPIISDNCSIQSEGWDITDGYFTPGTYYFNYSVLDDQSNYNGCTMQLVVVDIELPTLDCPQDTTLYTPNNSCEAELVMTPSGLDNCSSFVIENNHPSSSYDIGIHDVLWTITDGYGNQSTCHQWIAVLDTIAPIITCESLVTDTIFDQSTSLFMAVQVPIVDDNCSFTFSNAYNNTTDASDMYNVGSHQVLWTATDASGNESTCVTTVEVISNFAPFIICPNDTIVYSSATGCDVNVQLPLPLTNLANPINDYNGGHDASDIYPLGSTTIMWSADDINNITHTCQVSVTVVDTIAPIVVCPNDTILELIAGQCDIEYTPVIPQQIDNCNIMSSGWDVATANYVPGNYAITFTSTDESGNSSVCQQNIQVVDLIIPSIDCPNDTTVYLTDASCEATLLLQAIGSDNCSNYSITSSTTDFTFGTGNHQITWTIVDDAGNGNACLANITVLDTIAPMIWCESTVNDTLYFNELNTFLTIPTPQVSDNCTVSYSNDYNNSTDASGFYSEGFYPVTWTAIDASGNTATCITEVNVVTSTEEILICPTDTIVYVTSLECGAHINISLPLTNISNYTNNYNGSIDASGYYPVGEYQVQWSGLNSENTLLTCSTSVTVLDTISPVIICPDEIMIQTESGENMAYIIPETPFTSDNCAIDSISNSLFSMNSSGISLGLGSYNMAWTVVDIHGNVSSCVSVIHVVDTIQPEILCIDTIAQFVDNGLCSAQVLVNQPEITNSELNLTITNDLGMNNGEYYEFPTGITTMTWTVTDINNNTSTCSTVYIITDNLAPIVYCEDTITAYVTDQECVTWVELETPEFFENCTHSSTTNSYNGAFSASDFYPHGETDINWFVSDINGNLGMCTTTIQVIDTVAPELFCPDTLTISLLLGESYHVPDFSELVLPTDTCNYVINYWQEIAEGSLIQADTTILFFAQDQAGNTTECSIVIEIEYPNTPIIPDCPDIISFFADADCHIVVTDHTSDISSLLPPNSNYTVHQSPEPGVYSAVTEIQFWITDINGLTSDTCSTPVQVIDNTPPVLVNATDAILYLDSNCESIIPDFSEWISYEDACGNVVVYSQNPTAGTVIQGIQTINATYWMMDEEGNTTTLPYLFDIIVLDTISPVMLPMNPMVIYQTEDCQYNMPDIASTAISLSCDEVTISQSQPAGVFTPTPNFTGITILATDESGNETSQFVSIQLADTIAPVISVLDDVVIPQDPGMCAAQLDLLSLIEISDCDDLVAITLSEDNGGIYSIGEHDISYYAVDGSGNQSATHTVHITVQDTEAPTFISVNDTTICQLPFTQPIYVNDCGNLIQVQDNNPTLIVGTNLLQFTYSDGTHTIDYSYQVIVQEMPEIVWTTLSDSICQEATEMEIQVSGPDNYVIYMDDIALDQNIIHFNELSSGMHTIEVQAEHLGCTAQVSQTFEIVDAPLIDILSDTLAICGEAVQMEVMSTDDHYIWSIPSSMTVISHGQNEFELATTAYGEFEVLVQLTIAGCTAIDSVIVKYDEPVATPFAGDDQEIYLTSASLVESAEIIVGQAHWFAPDNQIYFEDSTLQSTTVYGLSLGQNEIILFVENGTCSASDALIINVGGLFIPSGYSPNGDGKNDQFIIKGIENIAESSLIIVNRWGQSVYSAVRYNNDWDGRDSGGEALPDDTYFYELSLDGEKHHGYVVLKR